MQGLHELGYDIVSTGGSAAAVEKAGVPVQRVEELTGFPEMLDGERPPPALLSPVAAMPALSTQRSSNVISLRGAC